MSLHKNLLNNGFLLPQCEKHFHDQDETWLILEGTGTSYWISHEGIREEFQMAAGDVWMVPAGYEHGSDGPNSTDFRIAVFFGTSAPGARKPAHYYIEEEGYIPSLQLVKTPTTRYSRKSTLQD